MQLRREQQNLQEFQNNYDDIEVALGHSSGPHETGNHFEELRFMALQTSFCRNLFYRCHRNLYSENKSVSDSLPDYETACKMLSEDSKNFSSS